MEKFFFLLLFINFVFPLLPGNGPAIVKDEDPRHHGNKDNHIKKNRHRTLVKALSHGNRQIGMLNLFVPDSV